MSSGGDRAALVTGASSGIGFAMAATLIDEGFAVSVVARDPDKLAAAVERLAAKGGEVYEIAEDLEVEAGVEAAVVKHAERFGRLDVLVNNAGRLILGDIAQIEPEHVERQLNLNLRAVIDSYRFARELLLSAGAEHGQALVINVASIAAKEPEPGQGVYSASKAAVVAFTESMNAELAPQGVRSCAICPAFVDTAMVDFARGDVAESEMIQPQDVAVMVKPLLRLSPAAMVPEIVINRVGNL